MRIVEVLRKKLNEMRRDASREEVKSLLRACRYEIDKYESHIEPEGTEYKPNYRVDRTEDKSHMSSCVIYPPNYGGDEPEYKPNNRGDYQVSSVDANGVVHNRWVSQEEFNRIIQPSHIEPEGTEYKPSYSGNYHISSVDANGVDHGRWELKEEYDHTTQQVEQEACPFCGSTSLIPASGGQTIGSTHYDNYVCRDCRGSFHAVYRRQEGWKKTAMHMVAGHWNI